MKKLKIGVLLFILVLLGMYFVYQEGSLPVDKQNQGSFIFTITKGEGLYAITKRLAAEDLIRNRIVFLFIAKQMGIEKKIQAGNFRLTKRMTAQEVAEQLTHGTLDEWVTIIEGMRKEEIALKLKDQFPISEIKFIENAPEGELFPDTYLIPKTDSEDAIIAIMQNNFKKKMAEARKQYPFEKRSDREALILASLVEREAKLTSDRLLVASIILKRIELGMPLQLDATIQYALGYQRDQKTWWKQDLTVDDLKVDSTYNTYTRTGLPPAPICNPGLESLKAALGATPNTPYLYYVSDSKGIIHPARTLEEHNANIRKYVQGG